MIPKRVLQVRALIAGICLLLIFSNARSAEAQFRFGLGRRSVRRINAKHEKIKSKADQAYQAGNYEQVIQLTTSVIEENRRDAVAHYLRGSARIELGLSQNDPQMMREGVYDAREAIRFDRRKTAMYYIPYLYGMASLAAVENRSEHAEIALQIANQALSLSSVDNETRANLLYQRARTHAYLRNFDKAIDDYQKATQVVPSHLGAHVGLAEAYVLAGHIDEARAQFAASIKRFPSNPLTHNNRGMFFQQQEQFGEAIVDFTRAIEVDPNYFYAYTNRAFSLMEMGDPQAAETDYTASLRLNPQQPTVYHMRGTARLSQGKIIEALEDQRSALKLLPEDPTTLANLGYALFFAEDFAEARGSFDKALSQNTQWRHLVPWQFSSTMLAGDAEAAKAQFKNSIPREKKSREWCDDLLGFLIDTKSEEELLKAAESPSAGARKDHLCEAHFFIGLKKRQAGETEQAERHFQLALETKSTHLSAYRGAQFVLKRFALFEDKDLQVIQ